MNLSKPCLSRSPVLRICLGLLVFLTLLDKSRSVDAPQLQRYVYLNHLTASERDSSPDQYIGNSASLPSPKFTLLMLHLVTPPSHPILNNASHLQTYKNLQPASRKLQQGDPSLHQRSSSLQQSPSRQFNQSPAQLNASHGIRQRKNNSIRLI